MTIHQDLSQSQAMLQAELAALRAENERLKANKGNTGGIKVSEKGAVSVYGLGRFPVTLYRGQWETLLLERKDQILEFIAANSAQLKTKGE